MKGKMFVLACSLVLLPVVGCSTTSESQRDAFNDDDVMFAQMMIPHHEQAIEMSDIALDPTIGASEEVRQLASEIKAAQDPEIAQMTSLLERWRQPLVPMDDMDHGSMMKGMLSPDDMIRLGQLTGPEFDVAWIEAMINHHEGAIAMAEEVLKNGENLEIRTLAESIIATQQVEIDVLRKLLP